MTNDRGPEPLFGPPQEASGTCTERGCERTSEVRLPSGTFCATHARKAAAALLRRRTGGAVDEALLDRLDPSTPPPPPPES